MLVGMAAEATVDVVMPTAGAAQVPSRTVLAGELARTMGGGAVLGALSGVLVGGVLGRLAMRLLAVTSPASAQGRMTDDQAVVGTISLGGTLGLALVTTVAGALAGLVYLWVRRVLPTSRRGRVAGYGVFAGSVGGALFVHDHPSFDYTVLSPTWLAVLLFVALPLAFGLLLPALVETLDRPSGWLRRRPAWLVTGLGLLVAAPVLPLAAPVVLGAFVIALSPRLRAAWHSRVVTVTGVALFALLVLWGGYGLVVDVVSVATDTPSTAPFNP
jgi:hypothetical protein